MQIVNLVLGDWSNDGHGKTEVRSFYCSHSAAEIKAAYAIAITNNRALKDIADDYEDAVLTDEHIDALTAISFPVDTMEWFGEDNQTDDESAYITKDEFVDLFWHLVKIGNSEITHTHVGDNITVNIGGYGFFS